MNHAQQSITSELASGDAPASRRTVISPTLSAVDDIMTRKVVTVTADTSVEALVEIMLSEGLSRLPVVDGAGRPVGMVAKTDVVEDHFDHAFEEDDSVGKVSAGKGVRYRLDGLKAATFRTVADLMTDCAVTIPVGTSIKEAARLMSLQNLHGLPVVDSAGRVIGVVSALDIAGWVAREC
jgi:CBS domain-containing protein